MRLRPGMDAEDYQAVWGTMPDLEKFPLQWWRPNQNPESGTSTMQRVPHHCCKAFSLGLVPLNPPQSWEAHKRGIINPVQKRRNWRVRRSFSSHHVPAMILRAGSFWSSPQGRQHLERTCMAFSVQLGHTSSARGNGTPARWVVRKWLCWAFHSHIPASSASGRSLPTGFPHCWGKSTWVRPGSQAWTETRSEGLSVFLLLSPSAKFARVTRMG